jgi:hypothetical protein
VAGQAPVRISVTLRPPLHPPAPFQTPTPNLNRYRLSLQSRNYLILRQSLVYRTKECYSTSLRNHLVSRPSRLLTPARSPQSRVALSIHESIRRFAFSPRLDLKPPASSFDYRLFSWDNWPKMRPSQILAAVVAMSSVTHAMSDAFDNIHGVADVKNILFGRQDDSTSRLWD